MNNEYSCGIEELFELLADSIDPSVVLHSKLMAQISSAIIKERIKLHMTQSEFADYIDVKQSLISRWEKGDYNFSLKKLSEIASKLNLDVNIVFCNISENKTSNFYTESFSSSRIIRYSSKEENKIELKKFEQQSFLVSDTKKEDYNYVTIR